MRHRAGLPRPAVIDDDRCRTIRDSRRAIRDPPDRIAVDFGVRVTVDAGVVSARATSEANFTVHLEWISDRLVGRLGLD
ncbi:hypothetical protein ACWT_3046 [Actinoplanes sp. SE50]|uniref:CU044_2847 family protein n=1 Tax=unclassified Actinoplanes TaxID=2626549 RepID=UPI00023EC0CC|nr:MULTISPECIES: CU044_2847 family protein [unclassified Actinoplanes]AEV84069.1 hypothetical protein ACPL_3174 [Actinoplanes sp. SE50/110]ATO82461.1 hypothetical protein ACWT_3046 [Actinoplanes sp. SE50]SLL99868.1 hypothetical protein ACSP50_3100 [Actinoplanes sp. SE50/110]